MMVLLTSEWPTASVNQQTDGRGLRLPTHSPTFRGGSSTEDLERPVRDYSYVSKGSRASSPIQLPVKAGAEAHQTASEHETRKGGSLGVNTAVVKTKPRCQVPLHRPHQVLAGSWSGVHFLPLLSLQFPFLPFHLSHSSILFSWQLVDEQLRCRFPGPRWLTGQNAINDTTFSQLAAFVHVCVSVHVYLVERFR
ncbi:hypothetical protein CH63R_13997 [Colletotrichum higginsianum IMI 349063]|uniref:Uncharacterized protein n=1 Tax=Colletotrichum higginsianum (strain IMI 349063) TaxID=759273 RepID=A0A1B7XSN1_COLHI|nr:hypothetical protein CH63R_13997 [Colletotrichum higginsianum IMI 349063]OBR02771.1 hypothetical protein CH63R_13997 [Colletotrichum higginsianum IMI 349063]